MLMSANVFLLQLLMTVKVFMDFTSYPGRSRNGSSDGSEMSDL